MSYLSTAIGIVHISHLYGVELAVERTGITVVVRTDRILYAGICTHVNVGCQHSVQSLVGTAVHLAGEPCQLLGSTQSVNAVLRLNEFGIDLTAVLADEAVILVSRQLGNNLVVRIADVTQRQTVATEALAGLCIYFLAAGSKYGMLVLTNGLTPSTVGAVAVQLVGQLTACQRTFGNSRNLLAIDVIAV